MVYMPERKQGAVAKRARSRKQRAQEGSRKQSNRLGRGGQLERHLGRVGGLPYGKLASTALQYEQ